MYFDKNPFPGQSTNRRQPQNPPRLASLRLRCYNINVRRVSLFRDEIRYRQNIGRNARKHGEILRWSGGRRRKHKGLV